MWRLRTLLLLLCICAGCVSRATGVREVFGYLGRDVNVSCSYSRGYESYEKYLCKNECGNDNDVLITTSKTKNRRFSIFDERNKLKFIVTIANLSSLDAGKYWCAVTRTGADLYNEVKLNITQDGCCSNVVKIQRHEEDSVSITCPYAAKYQTNVKFICRGNQPSTCLRRAVITSERTTSGRFTLTDDQRSSQFTATISRLTREDSGPYLCGVHSNVGLQGFSAVHLEVKEWCCAWSSNVTGAEGQAVTLQCPYPTEHRENRKFLCKGDHRSNCTDVVRNGSRFSLQDDVTSSSFSVTVRKLEAGDAGTYWCSSDSRWTVGNYTQIELSVLLQIPTSTGKPPPVLLQITTSTGKPPPVTALLSGTFSVIAVALTLIFIGVICRRKYHKKQEAEVPVITNVPKPVDVEEETRLDVYSNQKIVRQVKQSPSYNCDNFDEDQPEYGNIVITEEIYCNQDVLRANMQSGKAAVKPWSHSNMK